MSTALIVHLSHRPWWDYYYLHLAIPFAWLGGITVGRIFSFVTSRIYEKDLKERLAAILMCIPAALALAVSLGRLEATTAGLRNRPMVADTAVIGELREFQHHPIWAYADNPIYLFHAGLQTPPELAVVSLKRFWSGQITTARIVELCSENIGLLLLEQISRLLKKPHGDLNTSS